MNLYRQIYRLENDFMLNAACIKSLCIFTAKFKSTNNICNYVRM